MKPKVLVTGATGFLGSHLVKRLLQEDYQVIILKRSFSNTQRIEKVLPQLICYDLDRCDLAKPFQDRGKIETIIHAATSYGRKNENISTIFETNTNFPLRLLETAVNFNTETFLNTDTVVDKFLNPYSISKKQFMEWGYYFAKIKKVRFLNVKLEHTLGPGDDDSKFTTYVVKSCMNNVEELPLTYGEQKRDFVHIEDVISAYLVLLKEADKQAKLYQEYELGSGEAISIREFVEIVHKITQSKTVLKFGSLPYRDGESMFSQANIQALAELGWQPKVSLEKSLEQMIEAEKMGKTINNTNH